MSLDLSNKKGCTNTAGVSAWPADGDFAETTVMGKHVFAQVPIKVPAGGYDLTANVAPITGLAEGDILQFINTNGAGPIIFTDANIGVTYEFADQVGEFLCLKYVGDGTSFTAADFKVV